MAEIEIDITSAQQEQPDIDVHPIYGLKGDKGERGLTGNGISSITLASTVGLVDTYNINYTNGNNSSFTVTNGEKGEQGEQGIQGIQGEQGIQGIQGETGATPNITVNASVNNTVGTPSVNVVKTGTDENPIFSLAFQNLKGETGSIDNVTFGDITGQVTDNIALTNAFNSKQDTLVSGTNIKTINDNSILGSGNLTLDGLPSQSGQSGKFLTTDGTDASWGNAANGDINNLTTLGNSRLQYSPFSINSGTVLNGENNTLTCSGSSITCDPCTITTCDGRTKVFNRASSFDVLSDAEYKKYNFNQVGTLSKDKSKISGFSNSAYITLPNVFAPSSNTWEFNIKFTTPSTFKSNYNVIFTNDGYAIMLGAVSNNIYWCLSSNNSSWNIVSNQTTIFSATTNTTYWVKLAFNGTEYSASYSTDGINYTTASTVANSATIATLSTSWIGNNQGSSGTNFEGTIDFSQFNIKINNEIWWQGIIDGTSSDYDYTSVDGNNKVFKDFETGELLLTNDFKISSTNPSADYWLDTSTIPANLKVNGVINNDLVYIGDCTVLNGGVTALENRYFNDSGYLVEKSVLGAVMPDWDNKISYTKDTTIHQTPCDGYIYGLFGAINYNGKTPCIIFTGTTSDNITTEAIHVETTASVWYNATQLFPIKKDIYFQWNGRGDITDYSFIPMKGAN